MRSVMMPVAFVAGRAVGMAVGHLVDRRGTDADDFDLEVQRLARKRMLGVDDDFVALDGDDPDRGVLVVGAFGHEGHAGLDFHFGRESLTRDRVRLCVFAFSVAILGSDDDFVLVADGFTRERLLETGHDVVSAVEVRHGLVGGRSVEHFAVVGAERVLHDDDLAVGDELFRHAAPLTANPSRRHQFSARGSDPARSPPVQQGDANSRSGSVDAVTPFPARMSSLDPIFALEHLAPADVPANVELSRSVGWKDVESEWRVLHEAGDVRGMRHEGRVVAQGVLGDYGNATTLAKMVVASEWQRRGLGARLLDGFLGQADARGVPVGLCATDLGRPLYESRQFEVSGELVILTGTPRLGTVDADSVVTLVDAEFAVALDRRFSGCDRGRMMRARFREASHRRALGGKGRGFGLASAQGEGTLVGPILAETEEEARALAAALLAAAGGPVRIDVPVERVAFRQWLQAQGLHEQAVRVEMARGAQRMPWQVPQRFALATQAWG